nr:LysE family transporter [Actinomadura roseirufa]
MNTGSILAFWTVAVLLIALPGADWAFTIGAGLRGRSLVPAVSGLVTGYALVTVVVAAGVGALVAGSPTLLTGLTLVGGAYLVWHGVTALARPGVSRDPGADDAPDAAPPDAAQSGAVQSGAVQSDVAQSGAVQPGAAQPDAVQPGVAQPGAAQPGAVQPGAVQPGAVQPDVSAGTDWRMFRRGIGVSGLNPKGLLVFLALLPQFTDPDGTWPIAGQIVVLGLAYMGTCAVFYLCLGAVARAALHGRPAAARLTGRLSGAAMVGIGGWLLAGHLVGA